LEHRLETFREIVECWREFAGPLGQYFQVDEETTLIARTYRIFAGGQPIMLITEKFPETYFRA
jgi:chorismate-pyruvate lyase